MFPSDPVAVLTQSTSSRQMERSAFFVAIVDVWPNSIEAVAVDLTVTKSCSVSAPQITVSAGRK